MTKPNSHHLHRLSAWHQILLSISTFGFTNFSFFKSIPNPSFPFTAFNPASLRARAARWNLTMVRRSSEVRPRGSSSSLRMSSSREVVWSSSVIAVVLVGGVDLDAVDPFVVWLGPVGD